MKKYCVLSITGLLFFFSCTKKSTDSPDESSNIYKQRMREFVAGISNFSKNIQNDFIIIPQNGQEIVTENGNEDDSVAVDYLDAIDGVGREDLFYGYNNDDEATPQADRNYMITFLDICENNSVEVLTTDYCWTHSKMDNSYLQNNQKSYISFAAPDRELNIIPGYPAHPYSENTDNINSLADARNFLYLLNYDNFSSKPDLLDTLANTNYDVIIMDLFYNNQPLLASEISSIHTKQNGGQRLLISYMSIGEAENYRYYWNNAWATNPPDWLAGENPDWQGNFKVKYWNQDWQNIIYGNDNSYIKKIIDAGFDGVYLDIIDAFEYFE